MTETQVQNAVTTWRRGDDDARIGLVITGARLAAIGVEEEQADAAELRANVKPNDSGTPLRAA